MIKYIAYDSDPDYTQLRNELISIYTKSYSPAIFNGNARDIIIPVLKSKYVLDPTETANRVLRYARNIYDLINKIKYYTE